MSKLSRQLATAHARHEAGDLGKADKLYRGVLQERPNHAEALYGLGLIAFHRHRIDDAIDRFERAIEADPLVAGYHGSLGAAHATAGRLAAALPHLDRAVALDAGSADAHHARAIALRDLGRRDDAIEGFRRAAALAPESAEAHANLAASCYQAGRLDEALQSARAAVAVAPSDPESLSNLGMIAMACGDEVDAAGVLEKAVRLAPDLVPARANLGLALERLGRVAEAETHLRRVIELRPNDGGGYSNLGRAMRMQGRLAEAVALYRKAVELSPERAAYHSNLLMALNSDAESDARAIYAEHRIWNQRHAAPVAAQSPRPARDHDPGRRLKIGYLSPDFRRHPVGYVALPVIESHDREAVEVVCYANVARPDALTGRFRECADGWRDISRMSDAAVADRIRDDGIDILVDLAGHTGGNRLLVFARKPAPVQATWCGYPNTTGLDAVDWLIGDPVQTPLGSEHLFAERVVRMPHGLLCFDAPAEAPDVGPLPAHSGTGVTFGSLNNASKISAPAIALWARLLAAVPGSRLLLKYPGLDDPATQQRFREALGAHGIDGRRLVVRGRSESHREVLETYNEIDIALDPFPYSGAVTTLEALWMGVPVITLIGERMAQRQSAGHLTAIGHPELVAVDAGGYVALARRWAGDLAGLAGLRARLRHDVANSPLCDARQFANDLEQLYRVMWADWCGAQPRD